jgi:hypothetical protein
MKNIFLLSVSTFLLLLATACKKDVNVAEMSLASQMLAEKTWYLDFSKTGTTVKSYVGQTTYFINFLSNLTTNDSDGLTGTYTVEKVDGKLQIHVQAKTNNGNSIEYIYDIISIGEKNLILSYTKATTTTQLYYTTK